MYLPQNSPPIRSSFDLPDSQIMEKVRQSTESIYDPDIVPLDLRVTVINSYVGALRAVFIVTTAIVAFNLCSGLMLKEHRLCEGIDQCERDEASVQERTLGA
jgi:hypothetical protein